MAIQSVQIEDGGAMGGGLPNAVGSTRGHYGSHVVLPLQLVSHRAGAGGRIEREQTKKAFFSFFFLPFHNLTGSGRR